MAASHSKQAKQLSAGERITKTVRETKAEIRKVVWPGKKELINYTAAVLVTVLIVSIILGVVDTIFAKLFELLMHLMS